MKKIYIKLNKVKVKVISIIHSPMIVAFGELDLLVNPVLMKSATYLISCSQFSNDKYMY